MSETLATEGPWPELADGHGLSWEDADWQMVALGVTFQISTRKTSWIALHPDTDSRRNEDFMEPLARKISVHRNKHLK